MNEKKLFEIVARVFNIRVDEISYESNPENIESWDSFTGYVLLDEIETNFDISITMEESLEIKKIDDFKNILKEKGINFD
jgi:acyl carrier protein|tara:strand:+ start:412 stop:651 length:240 start_codon:yes stop_codon:yes gene_type:complete